MKRLLFVGDIGVLVAFSVLGLASHNTKPSVGALGRTLLPLLAAWFVAAIVLGTYRRRARGVTVATWIVAITLAALIRRIWLGHPTGVAFLTFLGVTLAVTGAVLGAWRLVAAKVLARRYEDRVPLG
ncbi:MAG: DUF3054 domain-containing protein [Actinomycetota bacterium]